MPKEGITFIFGSWICVANAQGGFDSHLNDSVHLEVIQPSVINSADEIPNQMRRLSLDQKVFLQTIKPKLENKRQKLSEKVLGLELRTH
jgi:predicted rRNA methylase YqxC with S4 and FtsJ domains